MQARASRGVHKGTWYFEIKVAHLGASGHCRLGWSTKKGELQARPFLCTSKADVHKNLPRFYRCACNSLV